MEDVEKVKEEIEYDLDSLDGYLDKVGLDIKFFAENFKSCFDVCKKGGTENRLHLDMLAKIRGLYKQSENKIEPVKYSWGKDATDKTEE